MHLLIEIEKNPPDVVGEVKGSDHMVMMSKPIELSIHLQAIADKFSSCSHSPHVLEYEPLQEKGVKQQIN